MSKDPKGRSFHCPFQLGKKVRKKLSARTRRKVPNLNPFTPRVSYEDMKVILTSKSVDEILWCDHSNETTSADCQMTTTLRLSSSRKFPLLC